MPSFAEIDTRRVLVSVLAYLRRVLTADRYIKDAITKSIDRCRWIVIDMIAEHADLHLGSFMC